LGSLGKGNDFLLNKEDFSGNVQRKDVISKKKGDVSGLNIPLLDVRISSLKCKFLFELQNEFEEDDSIFPPEHLRWL